MRRRHVVTTLAVGVTGLAGCLGGDAGGGFGGDEGSNEAGSESGDTEYPTLSNTQRSFVMRLDQELEVLSARSDSETLVVTVQTTGTSDEDLRLAAEAYVNFVSSMTTNLRVHVEDRGLQQSTFEIRQQWAERFANGRLTDNEYLTRIADTRTT